MKKIKNFFRLACVVVACMLMAPAAFAQPAEGAGCGFNTAGDYLCEGQSLTLPGMPPPTTVPPYTGPQAQDYGPVPLDPYTPGDLTPGIVMPYIPVTPIFTLPTIPPIPGIIVMPPIQNCEAVLVGPVGPNTPTNINQCTGEDCVRACNHSASAPSHEHCDGSNMGPASRAEIEARFGAVALNHEGVRLQPYRDGTGPGGTQLYSIGIGHQIRPGEEWMMNGITREQAQEIFQRDAQWAIDAAYRDAERAGLSGNSCAIVALAGVNFQKGTGWNSDRTGEAGGIYDFSRGMTMMENGQYCEASQYFAGQSYFSNSQWQHLNNRD